jgi:hypothetical protein
MLYVCYMTKDKIISVMRFYMRKEKINMRYVYITRGRTNVMCYMYVTWGRAKVIRVLFLLHEERQKWYLLSVWYMGKENSKKSFMFVTGGRKSNMLRVCQVRMDKSNELCVLYTRTGISNTCFVFATQWRTKGIFVVCMLHKEGQNNVF